VKRRLVLAFVILFVLLAAGVGVSIFYLWQSSSELQRVVEAHEIEELRQALSLRLLRSKQDLQASGTVFANELDDIIANVQALDSSVQACFDCHHDAHRTSELERITSLLERYKSQYSAFITAGFSNDRRLNLQLEAASTADRISSLVSELLLSATPALKQRTRRALAELHRSRQILLFTLVLTFASAIVLATGLVRSITQPVAKLADAARRLSAGELGLQMRHQESHEMGALMDAFNEMSVTLKADEEKIKGHSARLTRLNEALLSLHTNAEEGHLLEGLSVAVQDLIDAEVWGSVVESRGIGGVFLVGLGWAGSTRPSHMGGISLRALQRSWAHSPYSFGSEAENEAAEWPLGDWPLEASLRNFLIAWVELDGELQGALMVANKRAGEFSDEDGELLSALGHGAAEVMQNQHLRRELEAQLTQLRGRAERREPVRPPASAPDPNTGPQEEP
jgi:HAMP domain-containing protein